MFENFNPEHLWWFLIYVTAIFVAIGAGQFYMKRVVFLEPVKEILVWCLYGLGVLAVLQFGFPLIGINIW